MKKKKKSGTIYDAAISWIRKFVPKLLPKQRELIERAAIIDYVGAEGRMTSRFTFMTIISCGVATMGLLQSSPAVVIGAMLISPLMSPIMALGFGLSVMDFRLLRKSLEALVIGTALAIFVSFILVKLSPLNDPTPEILARTSPNLLDLVIAVFSALAGGYAVIRRKGETLVGVAIATALMPPLAVVGYGLATGKAAVASGSFFLFMTNLLAIALSVTLLAVWYGFGYRHGKHYGKWQVAIVLIVFGILSIPLGNSLSHIAYEATTTNKARSIINEYFSKTPSPARIELFHIAFTNEAEIKIDTLILIKNYDTKAQETLLADLEAALGSKVLLSLDQLVTSQEPGRVKALAMQAPQNTLSAPVSTTETSIASKTLDSLTQLRQALPIPADVTPVSDQPSAFLIHPKSVKGGKIGLFRKMEQELKARFDNLDIKIIPPVSRFPDIYFPTGGNTPEASGIDALEDCLWALKRWDVQEVQVVGFASTLGERGSYNNKALANQRAQDIARRLESEGLNVNIKSEYQTYEQRQDEKMQGMENFQKVEIRLIPSQDLLTKGAQQ